MLQGSQQQPLTGLQMTSYAAELVQGMSGNLLLLIYDKQRVELTRRGVRGDVS